jgi:hypothetical protein
MPAHVFIHIVQLYTLVHGMIHVVDPRFLSYMESHDVASIIVQALGVGYSNRRAQRFAQVGAGGV